MKTTTKTTRTRAGLDRIGDVVQGRPELAERTRRMLAGDLPCPDLETDGMGQMVYVPLRLPEDLVARADALAPRLQRDPRIVAAGRSGRSTVMRLALALGIDALEQGAPAAAPAEPAPITGKTKRRG